MIFPLTREDVSLIMEALELIGNAATSLLHLLSHYSLIQSEVQEWQLSVIDQVSFFFQFVSQVQASLYLFIRKMRICYNNYL